jgi:hypothetical protein
MRDIRLGDDIDDYCIRCKRVTNHVVVSVVKAAPAKVRCRSCHNDHDFRNEQPPPPKVDPRKQALFNEVLKKAVPTASADAVAPVDEALDVEDVEVEEELDVEEAGAEDVAVEAVAGVDEEAPKPALKAKVKAPVKAKSKARK